MNEQPTKITEMIIDGLVSGFFTVVAVFIGASLALSTYRKNEWWNAKLKMYLEGMDLWEELANASAALAAHAICGKNSVDDRNARIMAFFDVRDRINSYLGKSRFNLSEDARLMVFALLEEIQNLSDVDFPNSDMKAVLELANRFSRSFAEEARRDLRIIPWRQRFQISATQAACSIKVMATRVIRRVMRLCLIVAFGQDEGEKRFARRSVGASVGGEHLATDLNSLPQQDQPADQAGGQ